MSSDYTKNQHFVPRAYLKFFSKRKKNDFYINVYDKVTNKSFNSNINNIASKNNFYETSELEKNDIEKSFHDIESQIPNIINNIMIASNIMPNNSCILNECLKNSLSVMIYSQMFRTRRAQIYFDKLGIEVTNEVVENTLIKYNNELTDENILVITKYANDLDFIRSVEFTEFKSKKLINKCKYFLKERIWVVYKIPNNSELSLITSDNPVIYYNFLTKEIGFGNNGIARKETIIIFPLTPKIVLVLYPPDMYFGAMKKYSNKLHYLFDDRFINKLNEYQRKQSHRQIYFFE